MIAPSPPMETTPPVVVSPLPSETESTPAEAGSGAGGGRRLDRTVRRAAWLEALSTGSVCDWARRIPAGERVDLGSMATAKEQGFIGCPVCEPWEPT